MPDTDHQCLKLPLDHPMAKTERPKFEAYVSLMDARAPLVRNKSGYEYRDRQHMFVGWIADGHCI